MCIVVDIFQVGITARGERAVNTTALVCIHVAEMVDEAGKDHTAQWKLSKPEDEEEAEQEQAILLIKS